MISVVNKSKRGHNFKRAADIAKRERACEECREVSKETSDLVHRNVKQYL